MIIILFLIDHWQKMLYWIHLCPIVYAVNPMTAEANVFMVVSVSSRQALERCTQPHLIRTRLFDLLHYPVITQTGYRRTQGLILITLQTIEGNFQAVTKAGKYLHTWLLDFASHCCCWTSWGPRTWRNPHDGYMYEEFKFSYVNKMTVFMIMY